MRIEKLLLYNTISSEKDDMLKEGSTFQGEILDIIDEFILIDIKGHGVLKATVESELNASKGDEVSFLVKSVKNDEIQLKTLVNEEIPKDVQNKLTDSDDSISKLLKTFNIKESKLSIKLAESLMKYNAPVNEQNMTEGIKSLDKLVQLTNLTEDDKVVLITKDIPDDRVHDISKEKVDVEVEENTFKPLDSKTNEIKTDNNLEKDMVPAERVNIKNILLTSKDQYIENEDLSSKVKELLGGEITEKQEDEFVKIISFLTKNDIKPSLNNIKNIRELNQDPIEFSKDFEKIDMILDKFKGKSSTTELKDLPKNIVVDKENIIEKDKKIETLYKALDKSSDKVALNFKKEIEILDNKIEFLKEMNKDMSFLFLPMNFAKEELNGVLTLLKEGKKKKSSNDKINVFINLNTKNLGEVKILCQAVSSSVSIKIKMREEDLELFRSMENILIDKVSSIGYTINKLEFTPLKEIQIMDAIISNPNPTYFLDIKV